MIIVRKNEVIVTKLEFKYGQFSTKCFKKIARVFKN